MPARPLALWTALVLVAVRPAAAQEVIPEEDQTPRAAVRAFLDDARQGRWDAAARHFAPSPSPAQVATERTARELRAVLDTYLEVELEQVSDVAEGRRDDKLPPQVEEIGRVPSPSGRGDEPVRLTRLASGRWVFSSATAARAAAWYAELPDRWVRENLPEVLLKPGPRHVFRWQYLALSVLALASLAAGRVVRALLKALLSRLARRTTSDFDDRLLTRLDGPLTLLAATIVAQALLGWLFLTKSADALVASVLAAVRMASVYWGLIRTVELAAETARSSKFIEERPESRALLPLASRTAKIALTVAAAVVVLQKLGYPAASLLAGLGIGGLAFALAAQKTVENVFGSVMLSIDQPFRPGDLVKVEDLVGVVESVGLRSTRIRTAERTLVTIPNGRLADLRIESFAVRDRLRVYAVLTLSPGTPAEVLRAVVVEATEALLAHPRRHPEPAKATLLSLGANGPDVEATIWFATDELAELPALKQEVLLLLLGVVERNGATLSAPARVSAGEPPRPGAAARTGS
jgi:MscS family membrane protein